jgi:hypothetical protein
MPFNKSAPACQFIIDAPNKLNKEQIEEKNQERTKILSRATSKARDNLALYIFQQIIQQRKHGEALEQQLECMWQDEVETYQHNSKKKDNGPQLHTRIHLAETDKIDLIQGEFDPEDVPTKWNQHKQKQVPIRFTPKMIIGFEKGQPFRDHVADNWLPDGLVLKIFWAKNKSGNRIDWTYDCIITRDKNSTECDWDQ